MAKKSSTKKKRAKPTARASKRTGNRTIATIHADLTISENDVKRAAKTVMRGTKKAAKKSLRRLKKLVT